MLFFVALVFVAVVALLCSTRRTLTGSVLPVLLYVLDSRCLEVVVQRLAQRGHRVLMLDVGLAEEELRLAQRLPVGLVASYEQALADSAGLMVVAAIGRHCTLEWLERIG